MTGINMSLDESKLQRLVDGAMGPDERREFLLSIHGQDQHWREIALAFVEEQTWQQEFRTGTTPSSVVRRPAHQAQPAKLSWRMLWIAAGWLLMLGVGFQIGRLEYARLDVVQPGEVPRLGQAPENDGVDSLAGTKNNDLRETLPTMELQLVSASGQAGEVVELPVFDETQVQQLLWEGQDHEAIAEMNRQLSELGYRLDWQTNYLSGPLDEETHLVVPVRTVGMRYDGQ